MRVIIFNIILVGILLISINFLRKYYIRNKEFFKKNGIFPLPNDKNNILLFPASLPVLMAIMIGGFMLFDVGGNEGNNTGTSTAQCNYAVGIDMVRICIVGTWVSTPRGDIWNRIVMKADKTYDLYSSMPSSGSWGDSPDYTGTYTIEERRYSDTGKKYVQVFLKDSGLCNYQMIFDYNTQLVCNNNYADIRKGDTNPW